MPRSQDALWSPWRPLPVPLYSSESGVEMMGVMEGLDHGSVFHGILPLDQECEGHGDSFGKRKVRIPNEVFCVCY